MTNLFARTAIIVSIILAGSSMPTEGAYFVRYDYSVSAHGTTTQTITDADYLYDETLVEGEFTQAGNAGAGNYGTVKFLADIAAGRVFSYARMVGVQTDAYNFYGGTARVEHIQFQEELTFSIPAGTYPDGLYADLHGRMAGVYSSEVGAGAQVSGWISLGAAVYDTGILSVGVGDEGSIRVDEPFTVTATLAVPGSSFAELTEVSQTLSVYFHRNLCWAVEYNTGSGYVIGSAENDFYAGIQITALDSPDGVTWTSESGVFLSDVSSVDGYEVPNPALRILGNHPNPFNPRTTIAFDLTEQTTISLCVYDMSGRLVRELVTGEVFEQGSHAEVWNGRDSQGRTMPSGTYFYRLQAGDYVETKRMTLLK